MKRCLRLLNISLLFLLILLLGFGGVKAYLAPMDLLVVKESVVLIRSYDINGELLMTGSGFVVEEKNTIATNFHVIEGAHHLGIVTANGQEIAAEEVLIFTKEQDLALLKAPVSLKPLERAIPWLHGKGSSVTTISSPEGRLNEVAPGNVQERYTDAIEFTGTIDHGSSGGPLLTSQGRVLGIIRAIIVTEEPGTGLAIPIKEVDLLYQQSLEREYALLKDELETRRAFLPNIFDDVDGNELTIKPIWSRNTIQVYRTDSLETFYKLTSREFILEEIIMSMDPDPFQKAYLSFTPEERKAVADQYQYLQYFDPWWCSLENPNRQKDLIRRKENPEEWEMEQGFLDLGLLKRHEIPIFALMVENTRYKEEYIALLKTLPLTGVEQTMILLLNPSFKPREFTEKENQAVVDVVNSRPGTLEEKQKILLRLGYTLKNGVIRWR